MADEEISLLKNWLKEAGPGMKWRNALFERFHVSEGLVYYKETTRSAVVAPTSWRATLTAWAHDENGHMGKHKTLDVLRGRFWWPGYRKQVFDHVESCMDCLRAKTTWGHSAKVGSMGTNQATRPGMRLHLDVTKGLPTSKKGNVGLCTMVDPYLRWLEAFPIPDEKAKTLATVLYRGWIVRYGIPEVIYTDQGRMFTGELWKALCEMVGTKAVTTVPYNPQANGSIERHHRWIGAALRVLAQDDPKNWDEYVPHMLMVYRTTPLRGCNYSPFELLLGREPVLPLDFALPVRKFQKKEVSQFLTEQAAYFRRARAAVDEWQQKQQQGNKQRYDAPREIKKFAPGTWVLLKHWQREGESKKMFLRGDGPYKVRSQVSDHTVELEKGRGLVRVATRYLQALPAKASEAAQAADDEARKARGEPGRKLTTSPAQAPPAPTTAEEVLKSIGQPKTTRNVVRGLSASEKRALWQRLEQVEQQQRQIALGFPLMAPPMAILAPPTTSSPPTVALEPIVAIREKKSDLETIDLREASPGQEQPADKEETQISEHPPPTSHKDIKIGDLLLTSKKYQKLMGTCVELSSSTVTLHVKRRNPFGRIMQVWKTLRGATRLADDKPRGAFKPYVVSLKIDEVTHKIDVQDSGKLAYTPLH